MELFQVFWDDQKNLFLEFEKNDEEQVLFLPEKIIRVNFQFEMSKIVKHEIYYKQSPTLISIKKFYHATNRLGFSIELDEIQGFLDIQIKILRLTFFLNSGHKVEYTFTEKFNISDIWVNDDCYDGFEYIDLRGTRSQRTKVTQERVIHAVKTDFNQNTEERTTIYEKKSIENISVDNSLLSMIGENNKTLKSIEQHLKNLSLTLQNLPVNSIFSDPPVRTPQRIPGPGIERIRRTELPSLIRGKDSSAKVLVIKEMKAKFKETTEKNQGFSIQDFLKPMGEAELKAITLDDEKLMNLEEKAIQNQIKRFERLQEQEIKLLELKAPK
ncbi:MAG: hypothetical protein KGD72_07575 [Candidatus Lokiarchaeota archaeon]|nr:hypothetical protein [Candidatus Lokiarchaeota archaeon]